MEPDTSVEPTAAAGRLFDPSNAVPDEYDILCDGCGYSLIGIQSNKCPECGQVFDAAQLPFARVPWLHRRRLGHAKAYLATLRFIYRQPREFAEELLRPVRISIADARAFRRTTVNLVLLGFVVCLLELAAVVIVNFVRDAHRAAFAHYNRLFAYLAAAAAFAGTILFGLRILLYAMTDLPVFIWKGHPSLRESELSPIQCYAAAPLIILLLAPVLTLLTVLLYPLLLVSNTLRLIGIGLALVVVMFLFQMLVTPLRLMGGSGVSRRRIELMALYLPLHWLMMAFMCTMCTTLAVGIESRVVNSIDPGLRLDPPRIIMPRRMILRRVQQPGMPLVARWQLVPVTQPATATPPTPTTTWPAPESR